jgi:FdhE protein
MTTTPILQPGQIEAAAGSIPELRLPPATLFIDRAQRLNQLAEGHSLGDYLRFIAGVAECQQRAFDQHPEIPLPEPHLLASCREHAMPPLAPAGWHPHPHWREVARMLADAMFDEVPASGQEALALLLDPKKEWLESQAEALLAPKHADLNLATAPLLGAALQVQWTHLARQLQPHQVARYEEPVLCPVCGSHPVASVIRTEGATGGLRYLHCSLCGSEWHLVRSKCSNCDSSKGLTYYSIAGKKDLVRAETCPTCHSYLKVIHQEKDPRVDPVADDLATLALDLLMGEKNIVRSSNNYLMLHGNNG